MKKIEDEEKKGRIGPAFWLLDIVKRLEEAHRILTWTFCLTYYLSAGKTKNAFEEQQAMLSKKVDEFHSVWKQQYVIYLMMIIIVFGKQISR